MIKEVVGEKFSSFQSELLPSKSGLAYIPLYSPVRPRISRETQIADQLSPDAFKSCSSSEKDPESDSSINRCIYMQTKRTTAISRFLKTPLPPSKQPTRHEKSSGCVLTSTESVRIMEEKAKAKKLKEKQKEQRRRA